MLKIKRVFGSLQNDKKKKALVAIAITAAAVGSLVGNAAAQETPTTDDSVMAAIAEENSALFASSEEINQALLNSGLEVDGSGFTSIAYSPVAEVAPSYNSLASVLAAYGQYEDLVGQGTAGDISGETVLAAVTVESEASEASLASVRVAYTKYVDMLEQA